MMRPIFIHSAGQSSPSVEHPRARNVRDEAAADRSRAAFTLVELLVVIAIIGVLSAMTVGVARLSSEKMKRERILGELNSLVTAIEAYRAKFGSYPPDNTVTAGANRGDRSVPSPLYYELTGVIYRPNDKSFFSPQSNEILFPTQLGTFFGRNGFVNAGVVSTDAGEAKPFKNFLSSLKPEQTGKLTNFAPQVPSVTVLAVPAKKPGAKAGEINAWHYISTNPTNNPNSFDLWADFVIGQQTNLVGNWKQ